MIRVIIFTILGVGVFAIYSFFIFGLGIRTHEVAVKKDGLAGLGGAKLLQDANRVLTELMEPTALDHASFLDTQAQEDINKWRETYNKWREKK